MSQYYDPAQYNEDYSPPTCQSTASYKTAVQAAFTAAPPGVQAEICKLKKIIVQTYPTNTYSWGFWENPYTKPQGQQDSYVGIRSDSFNLTLAQEEDATEKNVLSRTPLMFAHQSNGSAALGLLAVIAHEIGHIIWHRDNVYLPNSRLPCYLESFIGTTSPKSWKRDQGLNQTLTRSWHPPPSDNAAAGNADYPVKTGPNPIRRPPATGSKLSDLIKTGFVTPFAAVSPEEDFVETYKLVAVSAGGATTLTLNVSRPDNASIPLLPTDSANPTTRDKVSCVGRLM